jgi:hypothetical protein
VTEHVAVQEIRRQHTVIEQWLTGADRNGWDSFAAALDDAFEIVAPDGTVTGKPALLEGFRSAFGTVSPLVIEVRSAVVVATDARTAVVRYEEWQRECTNPNARVSTAVMGLSQSAPLGWAWLALHETWLTSRG